MGRLRDGYDAPLWRSINEEVIDLFGNEDGILHRQGESNCDIRDPLWDEPTNKIVYDKYKIPYFIQDFAQPIEVDEQGYESLHEATVFFSRAHLDKAGVPKDMTGEQVRPGDILEIWRRGDRLFFDIIGVDREGFVNDSDHWTQYNCTLRRTSKFEPERETV